MQDELGAVAVLEPLEDTDESPVEESNGAERWREGQWDYHEALQYIPESLHAAICAYVDAGRYGSVKIRRNLFRVLQHREIATRALSRVEKTLSGERWLTPPEEVARMKIAVYLNGQDAVTLERYRAKFGISTDVPREDVVYMIIDAMLAVD